MALQGTIDSFPLVDVLQLLTTSNKTGRLDLVGDRGRGALWVADGLLVAGTIEGREAAEPADAVWELLRFGDGSFEFRVGEQPRDPSFSADVGDTVDQATVMLREWDEITDKVPGMGHRVVLAQELPGEDVRLRADDWSVVVAAGPGPRVEQLLDHLELAEFGGCRRLAELVDRGLIVVTPDTRAAQSPVESPAVGDPVDESPAVDLPPEDPAAEEEPPGSADDTAVADDIAAADASGVPGAQLRTTGPEEVPVEDRHHPEPYDEPESPELSALPASDPAAVTQEDGATQAGAVAPRDPSPAGLPTPEAQAVVAGDLSSVPEIEVRVAEPSAQFPDHFPIDDLVDAEDGVGWDRPADGSSPGVAAESDPVLHSPAVPVQAEATVQPLAPQPSAPADPFPNGSEPAPAGGEASEDVLAQIGRLSPKAAEAIAAALGDNHEQPQ